MQEFHILFSFQTIRDASKHQSLQLTLGDHLTQSGYVTLLVNMYKSLKNVGTDKAKTSSKAIEQASANITTILTTLGQFTAESVQMCNALRNEDILPFFIDELRKMSQPFDELEEKAQREISLILEILYQCIRHCSELRTLYRKHDVVPLLTKSLNTEEVNLCKVHFHIHCTLK